MDPASPWIPLVTSLVALGFSGVALGWNIYRDVILKGRVKVAFAVVRLIPDGTAPIPAVLKRNVEGGGYDWKGTEPQLLRIRATNHGPGSVEITGMTGRTGNLWKRLTRRPGYFQILNDYSNPFNPKEMPVRLEPGASTMFYLPHDERSFLATDNVSHIGVLDSFGREHFAPKRELKEGTKQFKEHFPKLPPEDPSLTAGMAEETDPPPQDPP